MGPSIQPHVISRHDATSPRRGHPTGHGPRSTPHDEARTASHGDRSTRVGGRHSSPPPNPPPPPLFLESPRRRGESHLTLPHLTLSPRTQSTREAQHGTAASPPAPAPAPPPPVAEGAATATAPARTGSAGLSKGPDKPPPPPSRPPPITNEQTRQATAGIARNSARPIHPDTLGSFFP